MATRLPEYVMTASCAYVLGHIGMCALERKDSVGNIAAVPCQAMKSEYDSMGYACEAVITGTPMS